MVVKNRNKCCPPHAAALAWWCLIAPFFCLEQLANGSRMLETLLLHENARLPSSPDGPQARDGYLEWNDGIRSTSDQGETEEVETPLVSRHWKLRGRRSHLMVAGATQQQQHPIYEKQVPILSRRSLSALQHSHQSGERAHSPAGNHFGAYDLEEPIPPPHGSSSTQETTVSTSVRIPAHMDELMSMDYTPVHRKPPINNEIPYFPAHYKPNELIPSGN